MEQGVREVGVGLANRMLLSSEWGACTHVFVCQCAYVHSYVCVCLWVGMRYTLFLDQLPFCGRVQRAFRGSITQEAVGVTVCQPKERERERGGLRKRERDAGGMK